MTPAVGQANRTLVAASVFLAAAIAYTLLGAAVSHVPPVGVDAAARALAGEAPGVAWIFTASCLWPNLLVYGLAGCVAAFRFAVWRGRIVFAIVITLITWQLSDALKNVFARPRPEYWIVHHEPSFAYSSGHAMFAILVYGLWAYHLGRSDAPPAVRVPFTVLLCAWAVGVIWSRLALGAHYPSDLVGGVLLAIGMLALGTGVARLAAPGVRII